MATPSGRPRAMVMMGLVLAAVIGAGRAAAGAESATRPNGAPPAATAAAAGRHADKPAPANAPGNNQIDDPATAADHTATDWAVASLTGAPQASPPLPADGLSVERQDHGTLQRNRSVVLTPLTLGQQTYGHGLGTHSVSDIRVRLPKPAARFHAQIGIDNNGPNGGGLGSVVFAVESAGRERYRSPMIRGGQPAVAVDLDLAGEQSFRLQVFDGGDGESYDQADWADARVDFADGSTLRLDELPLRVKPAVFPDAPPISFKLAGKPSSEFLAGWTKSTRTLPPEPGSRRYETTWIDPATSLGATVQLKRFADVPAAEWLVTLHNGGTSDSPLLEEVLALDATVLPPTGDVTLLGANGSTAAATDFLPNQTLVPVPFSQTFAPAGGRPSDGRLPFFNVAWPGGGVMAAIGWTGQWNFKLDRTDSQLRLRAGQEKTHFILHPGETVRLPRILLVGWSGDDPERANLLLRRTLLRHYVPRRDGQPVLPMVSANTWFIYNSGNGVTEANQLEAIESMARLGSEAYWLDAGWFEGGWPGGVGSWVPRADAFPHGLRPLADAAHARQMKFILWFEPERVSPQSRIAREHPQWVLHVGNGDGLFNLGDPEARRWMTDTLCRCIEDWKIDVFRSDFNAAPLPFWQAADPPDRQGISEIRYVEGLYEMWDAIARCRGGTLIDNCASGGRRIDLETISRAVVLTRSDSPGVAVRPMPVQEQTQTMGLSPYCPAHSTLGFGVEPYDWLSTATAGQSISQRVSGPDEALARRMIALTKRLREYWSGDFYALTPIDPDNRDWAAWQLDLPESGKGCVYVFRRAQSPYLQMQVKLQAVRPDATYKLTAIEGHGEGSDGERSATGEELNRLPIQIDETPGVAVMLYERAGS